MLNRKDFILILMKKKGEEDEIKQKNYIYIIQHSFEHLY